MTRTLLRNCVGCGRSVRGRSRCTDCQRDHDRAKRGRRPDLDQRQERRRRERIVADHRANVGDWCPGLDQHPAHPSADLVADHVVEVAAGGPSAGPLRVLCRSENSRRSANLIPPIEGAQTTPRPPNLATQTSELLA
jgi:5-methylcytosine-specific restriction enzyme A